MQRIEGDFNRNGRVDGKVKGTCEAAKSKIMLQWEPDGIRRHEKLKLRYLQRREEGLYSNWWVDGKCKKIVKQGNLKYYNRESQMQE